MTAAAAATAAAGGGAAADRDDDSEPPSPGRRTMNRDRHGPRSESWVRLIGSESRNQLRVEGSVPGPGDGFGSE